MSNLVTMRDPAERQRAGSHLSSGMDVDSPWHQHDLHQLLYAFEGAVEIEDERARCLVPHQYAAWIPAGTLHRTTIHRVQSGSVFLSEDMVAVSARRVFVVRVPALMREMILASMRWPLIEGYRGKTGQSFFETFALLCEDWLGDEAKLILPTSRDPLIARIMAYTADHLQDVTTRDVCRAVHVSERSMRRNFSEATGMTWEEYRARSRIFRSIEKLEESDDTLLKIAEEVGYRSPSAFARAFKDLLQESPAAYRRRIRRRS